MKNDASTPEDVQALVANLECSKEPEPLGERPTIIYAKDLESRRQIQRLIGQKHTVYWTSAAVSKVLQMCRYS